MPNATHTQCALPLPAQRPGVPRLNDARGWVGIGGVEASLSCGDLTGQARSICYALHGVQY